MESFEQKIEEDEMANARDDVKRAIELIRRVHHSPESPIHAVPGNLGVNEVQALALEGGEDVLAALSEDGNMEKQQMLEKLFYDLVEEKVTSEEVQQLVELVAEYKERRPKKTVH